MDRYASLLLGIVSSMFIARLLTPKEIGVFSVTMVLLSYMATVRDMGAGQYLIQEKTLTIDRIRAVWAVQLGLGWLLALVVLAASLPVAAFYHEPKMVGIMLVIAANYAINPFGSMTYAWQVREMRFDALAITRFSATLTGAVVSVYLAWRGMGAISLALGALGSTLVNAVFSAFYRPKHFPWLPGTKEISRVLSYGTRHTGSGVLQTIGGSAPELLIAKFQSITDAGFLSRASGLVMMFNRLILDGMNTVAISWFSKESRGSGNIVEPFLRATSYVTAIGWSFAVGTVLLASPVIRLLYGEQWGGAVDTTHQHR